MDKKAYRLGDELTLNVDGKQIKAEVTSEINEDGYIEVYTENARINGKVVNIFKKELLDLMTKPENHLTSQMVEDLNAYKKEPKPVRWEWSGILGCGCFAIPIIALLFYIAFSIYSNQNEKQIKKQKEQVGNSIRDSVAKDSLLRMKFHYDSIKMDSVDAAIEKEEEKYLNTTSVIYIKGDSLYHSSTFCERIEGSNNLKLILLGKALDMDLKECPECNERESVYSGYECGDYIYIDDIPDENY